MPVAPSAVHALPKVVLHDHLDGGVRPRTIVELAQEIGYAHLPSYDPETLEDWFFQAASSGSLEQYLTTFTHTVAVMQERDAIARIAMECVEDLAADGVVWAEIRMAPELSTAGGLTMHEAVQAMLDGLREGEERVAARGGFIRAGLLLCSMRHLDRHLEVAETVLHFRDDGVVGFDIAGPERGFPARRLQDAFDLLRRNNARITVHAGEAGGLESIQDALLVGAERLGHGHEISDDIEFHADGTATLGRLATYVRDRRIPLELCPTSNVQTGGAVSVRDHAFEALRRLGFVVTVNCDNRLMSRTNPTVEMGKLVDAFGYTSADLMRFTLDALDASFAPWETKAQVRAAIEHRTAALTL